MISLDGTLDAALGLQIGPLGEDEAHGCIPEVHDGLCQPMGPVHGGVFCAVAETIASWATAQVVMAEGKVCVGQSNAATFLRPITEGAINVHAKRIHRGRSSWVWDVDITDSHDRLCAVVRMTVAVRDGAP